jgi:exopolysaccharide biosynthesis predicted pyruvyltransferase EpsI
MLLNSPHSSVAPMSSCSPSQFNPNDPYVDFLLKNKNRLFYMKAWNGNSGDTLIWLGTDQLLKDLQIRRTQDPRAADIILMAGGNQTMWQTNVEVWREVWSRWPDKDLVIGPTTIRLGITTWDQDLRHYGLRVRGIFARDPESYAILRTCKLNPNVTIGLSHDPALYLRDSELIRTHREATTEEFILAAFRDDHEAAANNHKWLATLVNWAPARLSQRVNSHWKRALQRKRVAQVTQGTRGTLPLRICDASLCSLPVFLEIVRSAAEVHTDRLHCMLLAAMLGKPTFAYPTAYGKLEAVYAHSVRPWAHVEFITDDMPSVGPESQIDLQTFRQEPCKQPAI